VARTARSGGPRRYQDRARRSSWSTEFRTQNVHHEVDREPLGAPWDALGWDGSDDEREFTTAADDTPEQLYALWDDAVERSRGRLSAALADGGLGQLVHASSPDGAHASLRRIVCDLIEEYGRHTGHAGLLREAVDGRTGEDPPAGWQPRAGHYRVHGS
jgi:hypothetical protein